jgi:peroxiredoxin
MVNIYIRGRMIMVSATLSLKDQVIQKAWEDAEFKAKLIADPKAAVKEAFGVDVPDEIEVEVVEENANKYYLVIPQNPATVQNVTNDEAVVWP